MENLLNDARFCSVIGKWDWQPKKLKKKFSQLTLSDVTLVVGKENELLTRIGNRLNKTPYQVVYLLKNLSHI